MTAGAQALALGTRSAAHNQFWDRAAFWRLTLSGTAIVAAGAAGIISEYRVHGMPAAAALRAAHQRDGTLLICVFPFGPRIRDRGVPPACPAHRARRVAAVVLVCGVSAAVMVSITGPLGGTMVYQLVGAFPRLRATRPRGRKAR